MTKAHLAALLRKVYHVTIASNKSKADHVKCLSKEINNDGGAAKLQSYYDSLPAAAESEDESEEEASMEMDIDGDEDDGIDYGEEY